MLATCNRLEVYADVDRFHGGVDRRSPSALVERPPAWPLRRPARAPLRALRRPRRRAPVHGRLRPGLDGRRRGPDPRPGPRRAARRPGRRARRPRAERAVPAGPAGRQAGPRRDRHRPRQRRPWSSAGARPGRARRSARSTGLRVLVVGAGVDGRAGRDHRVAARRRATSSSPTAPPSKAERLAERTGGRARAARRARPRRSPRPTCVVSCTGAVGHVVDRRAVAGAAPVARGGRPLVYIDLALPHDVDPAVAALPGVTLVDLAELGEDAVRAGEATPHVAGGRATSSIAEVAAFLAARAAEPSPRPWSRCARWPPTSSPPSWPGSTSRLPDLDERDARRGRSWPCAGSSRSCCTRRPCG